MSNEKNDNQFKPVFDNRGVGGSYGNKDSNYYVTTQSPLSPTSHQSAGYSSGGHNFFAEGRRNYDGRGNDYAGVGYSNNNVDCRLF